MSDRKFGRARRQERQEQAAIRQAEYDNLTPAQKLARLDQGGYTATKQRARLKKTMKG